MFFRHTLLALALLGTSLAQAAPLKVDAAKSKLTITFKQMNVPVDAQFKKFAALLDYDAAKPEATKAQVEIDVASFDVGDADYNKEVLKKEWFNAAQFAKASFVLSSLKPAAAGTLTASGKLTIKGKVLDVQFPLNVKPEGKAYHFTGKLPIKRLSFNIGEGEWKDTGMVADEVTIQFNFYTQP